MSLLVSESPADQPFRDAPDTSFSKCQKRIWRFLFLQSCLESHSDQSPGIPRVVNLLCVVHWYFRERMKRMSWGKNISRWCRPILIGNEVTGTKKIPKLNSLWMAIPPNEERILTRGNSRRVSGSIRKSVAACRLLLHNKDNTKTISPKEVLNKKSEIYRPISVNTV